MIFIAYVNDGIFLSPHPHLIDDAIWDLIRIGLEIVNQGFLVDYVRVNIKYNNDGSMLLS